MPGLRQSPSLRQNPRFMVLPNGHAARLQEASPDRLSPCKLMEVSSVPPTIGFLRKNVVQNETVRFACCMQPASAIAANVSCVPNVKKVFLPCPPRRVSVVFWPVTVPVASASIPSQPDPPPKMLEPVSCFPVLWGDWPRCQIRRTWLKVVRSEMVVVTTGDPFMQNQSEVAVRHVITRAQRAHWRLSWDERFARNRRTSTAKPLSITIHGLPATFADVYGFPLLSVA